MWYENTLIIILHYLTCFIIYIPHQNEYMNTKLNLKLAKEDQRKFPISEKFFELKVLGVRKENVSWINLYIIIENDTISFFLDMYPLVKSNLYYGLPRIPWVTKYNINTVINKILQTELEVLPNGIPWNYHNRQAQFKDLSEQCTCIIFWCGEYELRIKKSYQFFDNIIEMLKRE